MKKMKRTLSKLAALLLVLVMVLSLATVTAHAGELTQVSYLDENGKPQTCTSYTVAAKNQHDDSTTNDNNATNWGENGVTSWYVVNTDINIQNRLVIRGDVNLILCDGVTLTVGRSVVVQNTSKLTIYAQSTGDNAGKLIASYEGGDGDPGNSGIGIRGNGGTTTTEFPRRGSGGEIVINGGVITATGWKSSPSWNNQTPDDYAGLFAKTITINGGKVTATAKNGGYGIMGEEVTINGGYVEAKGASETTPAIPETYGPENTEINLTWNEDDLCVATDTDLRTRQTVEFKSHVYEIKSDNGISVTERCAFCGHEHTYQKQVVAPVVSHTTTSSKAHTITSQIGTITRVVVDGKELASRYYTVYGSDVVLSDEFMRALSNGAHTVQLYDGNTRATAVITVSGNTLTAPKTADPGVVLYGVMAVSSALGLAWMGKKKEF